MSRLALFIAISGLSFAATAQEPAPPPAVAASEESVVAPESSVIRAEESRDPSCARAPCRVHSRDDIVMTGSIDLSKALRMLDPAIF